VISAGAAVHQDLLPDDVAHFNGVSSVPPERPDDTVCAFKAETSPETLSRTADQAHDLARSTGDEEELRTLMLDLGIEYMPWAEGWSSHALARASGGAPGASVREATDRMIFVRQASDTG
jgi:hypothetical protein